MKQLIYSASERVVQFLNDECDHQWMTPSTYAPPRESADVEGVGFRLCTSGGPLMSFLTLLLLPVVIPCETMGFSILTYNNKRYESEIKLDMRKVVGDNFEEYVEECLEQMIQLSFYSPVLYIPRFLAALATILVPSETKCHFGELYYH